MQTSNPLRPCATGGDFSHGKGGRVGSKRRIGRQTLFQCPKELVLGVKIFDNRFDRDAGAAGLVEGADWPQTAKDAPLVVGSHPPFRHQTFKAFVDRRDCLGHRAAT